MSRIYSLVFTACVALFAACVGDPQSALAQKAGRGNQIVVRESFEPTFRIEPLVNRLNGRSNEELPFKFNIESANRDTTVEIVPIGLAQDISGQVLHNTDLKTSDTIRILTPQTLKLEANKSAYIEGLVKIPRGDAKHHSYGIMVRDIGSENNLAPSFDPSGKRKTQAGVRFMTQYVLRLDVEVDGNRGEQVQQLSIEEASIQPRNGRPLLQAIITNPSDTTFEFELRARLRSSPSDRTAKQVSLVMPIRAANEDDSRKIGRILGKSRIRMEELLPEAIAGGQYEVDLEVWSDQRAVKKKTISIDVDAEDFPAQEVVIAQVGPGLQVSPAQIELSHLRGGSRRVSLLLKNHGKEEKTVQLKALSADELPLGSVTFQPSTVKLAPGASRKIAMTLIGGHSDHAFAYGHVLIESQSDRKEFRDTRRLPLAILYKKGGETNINVSPLAWDPNGKYPAFRTTVENTGTLHFPVDARLTISSELGRRYQVLGGFGQWVMPGQKTQVAFRLDFPLPPDNYKLKCEFITGGDPAVVEQEFVVSDLTDAADKKPVSTDSAKKVN